MVNNVIPANYFLTLQKNDLAASENTKLYSFISVNKTRAQPVSIKPSFLRFCFD